MANRFTAGKKALSECDRCGFRFKLKELQHEVIKTKRVAIKSCPECWSPDHPQLQLGMQPIADPQAVRDPRPDFSGYPQSREQLVPVYNFIDQYEYTSAGGTIGNVTVVVPPTDPYFSYVSLLLHMDGSNGSTTFTDNSPSPKTMIVSDATVTTSTVKFGTGGGLIGSAFSGTPLSISSATVANFLTNNFTVEGWVYSSATNYRVFPIVSFNSLAAYFERRGAPYNDITIAVNMPSYGGGGVISITLVDGWNHWAFVRNGTSWVFYINGQSAVTDTTVSGYSLATSGNFNIGYIPSAAVWANGVAFDDVRITNGIARYTANFAPPTAAFPNS